ncbi:MAG: glycosyltransferase family 2 protein [Acidimicrobiales bacterium]
MSPLERPTNHRQPLDADTPSAEPDFGARPDRHPLARKRWDTRPLMAIGLLAMVGYAGFRVSTFLYGSVAPGGPGSADGTLAWLINITLFAGESVAFVANLALIYDGWRLPTFSPPRGTRTPPVDVLVPVYNEPIEVVRPTLSGCLGQDYPGPVTVWLLDDGQRPELAALAEDLGITYVVRSERRGAKAGNINHALPLLGGELVTILDCDMVPQPDYLSSLVPYFENDDVALVQTPHGFYNTDSFQHFSTSRHEQSLFYDVLQWGKERHNAAYWCGTGGVLRTEALRSVGGVAETTITEDFHTSIRLHAAGWSSRYHPIALTFGLGATNHATYAGQRDRWGSGNIAVLHTDDNPLTVRGLTLSQRLSYGATLVAVLAGLRRLLLVAGVSLMLVLGQIPFRADWRLLAIMLTASVIGSMTALLSLGRGRVALGDLGRGEILASPAQLSALRTLVDGRRSTATFRVTAKDATAERWQAFVATNRALLIVTVVLISALIVGGLRQLTGHGLPGGAAAFTYLLGIWEAVQLGLAWRFGLRYHQRRTSYRVRVEGRRAQLTVHDDPVLAKLVDLSPAGAAAELFDDVDVDVGDQIGFSVDGMPTAIAATVRRAEGWELGLRFDHVPAEAGMVIDRICYVDGIDGSVRRRPAVEGPDELDRRPEPASSRAAPASDLRPGDRRRGPTDRRRLPAGGDPAADRRTPVVGREPVNDQGLAGDPAEPDDHDIDESSSATR